MSKSKFTMTVGHFFARKNVLQRALLVVSCRRQQQVCISRTPGPALQMFAEKSTWKNWSLQQLFFAKPINLWILSLVSNSKICLFCIQSPVLLKAKFRQLLLPDVGLSIPCFQVIYTSEVRWLFGNETAERVLHIMYFTLQSHIHSLDNCPEPLLYSSVQVDIMYTLFYGFIKSQLVQR